MRSRLISGKFSAFWIDFTGGQSQEPLNLWNHWTLAPWHDGNYFVLVPSQLLQRLLQRSPDKSDSSRKPVLSCILSSNIAIFPVPTRVRVSMSSLVAAWWSTGMTHQRSLQCNGFWFRITMCKSRSKSWHWRLVPNLNCAIYRLQFLQATQGMRVDMWWVIM